MSSHDIGASIPGNTTGDGRQRRREPNRAPGAFVVTAARRPVSFRIDEEAFKRWCADYGDDLDCIIPDVVVEDAGAALSRMVYEAWESGVIVGNPDLRLDVNGDDDTDGPGFYVLLHNAEPGAQRLWLTSGWTELRRSPEGITPADTARHYLDEVCALANGIVDAIEVAPATR